MKTYMAHIVEKAQPVYVEVQAESAGEAAYNLIMSGKLIIGSVKEKV